MQAAQHFERETYRNLFPGVGNIRLALFARAIQIADWASTSLFCPACGARCVPGKDESVSRCPDCGHDQYPRMAPAMIVAVVRNGRLLLARAPRFRGAFHSVLAGFVEPGESVEDCIHREVWEETRVMVKNIRYFGSQSWPFPHSLMLAYTAEWSGGEIQIDSRELEHAAWYAPDELPPVPGELSIAGRLIRWFVETGKPETAP
jgi:NAD+ diphosphatase